MAKKSIGTITLPDGTKKDVLEQKGKYYICEDAQYLARKYTLDKPKKGVKKNAESELSERTATGTEREEHECDRGGDQYAANADCESVHV